MALGKKIFFLIIALSFSVFNLLWARDVEIIVEDTDLGIPLEGAAIRSWDNSDYMCDENGIVIISVPDDRQVTIQVQYPGYENGRLIIPLKGDSFKLGLRLGGVMESRELVIEARRPGSSETKSGRSVAISGEALERSSQIGLIEDVMTSIKLLPGVGYTGMFNAMPSIRGGEPGDLMAVLDGFYIENPYHWGGGFSIFDPHMVASAQLSHGIFSTRYGHTISGLLEITSKKASPDLAELELGLSTSAVNLNLSMPLGTRGGLMVMGKVTYWDPFVWAVKQLSKVIDNDTLQMVNAVTTAPYIRSSAINVNYRFNADLEWTAEAFIGADGVGADYSNESNDEYVKSKSHMVFDWDNLQGFLITGLTFNPRRDMVLKTTAGAGFAQAKIDGEINYDYLTAKYTNDIIADHPSLVPPYSYTLDNDDIGMNVKSDDSALNIQGRIDYDWSLGNGFLWSIGAQEIYSHHTAKQEGRFFAEMQYFDTAVMELKYIHFPRQFGIDFSNGMFNTSAYTLLEYLAPGGRFGAELGLRVDHFYFSGDGFDIQTVPVLNPRLNLDFNVFKNKGIFDSFDLTAGTGLFSSMNDAVASIQLDSGIDDFTLKPNRSWTSVVGMRTDIMEEWSFNLEGYFKFVYDRAYQYLYTQLGAVPEQRYRFNGDGIIWGFDAMLQKFDSRYWDGWLSYTFTYAKYHQPEKPLTELSPSLNTELEDSGWYYPGFHRFHNINMVINFKPLRNFNIYTRLGIASGRLKPEITGKITSYLVDLYDDSGAPTGKQIIKYKRESEYNENSRTTWSIPLDTKFSYFIFNPKTKMQTEIYLGAENLLSLVYVAKANTSFNQYTGKEDTGSDSANYEMPIPMVSFGLKWSY
ncbi:TonB-dependent receptor plug domain-containing protein [Leadbettera azotonutricia]|uniref:TonB-dependent receptor plug domain protein n=1 Tax=Leadbettera azotonutricia (strain ATCC BAA-888 / DSM 13862 / ZAS-9) TaxID=545695 RepID=F5YCT3_LEAAZ|nr:TonB-dependent receptor plug domain-containing protein [Leadbettera azotonutricia]AEF82428.1 TonB-dependent receptor plug domain protein [Leadbettera azotonutricia ZAS-9]